MEAQTPPINWPRASRFDLLSPMTSKPPSEARPAQPQTRWSLIARVQTDDPHVRQQALDELLAVYYPVLRKFLVAGMGIATETASDLLQGFVAEKILGQDAVASAQPEKGRFRNFLFMACRHYVISVITNIHRLRELVLDRTLVADLSPLTNLPLLAMRFNDSGGATNVECLRAVRTLKTINDLPAADFWKRFDAGEFTNAARPALPARPAPSK
jgi:hypothetical protein